MLNILIVEDEQDIRTLLELHLYKEGYTVFQAGDGIEGLRLFENNKIDIAILDVMLPVLDGFKVLKKIREASTIPVIFLTAKADDVDKILALGLGADDYIVKPFNPLEVVARVQAQLRRANKYSKGYLQKQDNIYKIGRLTLDRDKCVICRDNIPLELNVKEYRILEFLINNKGKVFTKKQIYEQIWEEPYLGEDNTVMVYMSRVRTKIEEDPRNPKYLKSIRGIGYKIEEAKE